MNELEAEKICELLKRHYNLNEANALCRCILNKDLGFYDFCEYLDEIVNVNCVDKSDNSEYIEWLESL